MSKKITQRQIAKLVGVSQPVVSAILRGDSAIRCSPEKREEILRLAESGGYRPNRQAIILRQGKSRVIGLVQQLGYNEVSEQRAAALAAEVKKVGYRLMVVNMSWYVNRTREMVDQLIDAAVDGLLLSNTAQDTLKDEFIQEFENKGIPVVALSADHGNHVAQVHSNTAQSFYDLTMHCIRMGRKNLVLGLNGEDAYLHAENQAGSRMSYFRRVCVQGFVRAIREVNGRMHGTIWDLLRQKMGHADREEEQGDLSGYVNGAILLSGRGWFNLEDRPLLGRSLAERMIATYPQTDALICRSDDIALGALQYCVENGIEVGRDLSITGYDDIVAGRYSTIPLTTVAQPVVKVAHEAVGLLLDRINGCIPKDERPFIICDSSPIIVRNSCGANLNQNYKPDQKS